MVGDILATVPVGEESHRAEEKELVIRHFECIVSIGLLSGKNKENASTSSYHDRPFHFQNTPLHTDIEMILLYFCIQPGNCNGERWLNIHQYLENN